MTLNKQLKPSRGFNYLLKSWAPFQVVQFHDVVTVQDESVSILSAGEIRIQLLHTTG